MTTASATDPASGSRDVAGSQGLTMVPTRGSGSAIQSTVQPAMTSAATYATTSATSSALQPASSAFGGYAVLVDAAVAAGSATRTALPSAMDPSANAPPSAGPPTSASSFAPISATSTGTAVVPTHSHAVAAVRTYAFAAAPTAAPAATPTAAPAATPTSASAQPQVFDPADPKRIHTLAFDLLQLAPDYTPMQAYVHNDKTLGKAARWLNKLERADAVSVYRLNDPQELKTCVQKFVIMTAQVRAMVESEWVEEWSIVEDPASLFAKASSMASGVSAADSTAIVALRDQLLAEINSKGWLPTETSQWYLPFRDDAGQRPLHPEFKIQLYANPAVMRMCMSCDKPIWNRGWQCMETIQPTTAEMNAAEAQASQREGHNICCACLAQGTRCSFPGHRLVMTERYTMTAMRGLYHRCVASFNAKLLPLCKQLGFKLGPFPQLSLQLTADGVLVDDWLDHDPRPAGKRSGPTVTYHLFLRGPIPMVACHLCGEQRGPQDVITCNDLKHALQLNPNESRAAQSPFFCFRCVKERFGESGMREPWSIDLLSTRDWSCFVCQGKCPKESHWELNAPPATEAPPAAIVEAGTTSEEEYYEEGASGTVSTRKRSRRGPATPEQTAANVSFAPSVPTSAENNDRTGIKIRLPGRKSAKKPGSGSAELPATSSPPSGFPAPIDVQHTSPFGASAGYYGAGPSYPYAIPTPAQMLQMQQMQQTMAAASQMVAMQRLSTTSVGVSTADDPAGLAMGQTPAPLSSLEPQVAEYINDLQKRYLEVQYANERYREQLEGLTNVINNSKKQKELVAQIMDLRNQLTASHTEIDRLRVQQNEWHNFRHHVVSTVLPALKTVAATVEEQTAVLTRFSGPPASFLSGEVGAGASTIAATGGSASVAKRKGPTASARDVEDVGSSDRAGK